MIFWQFPGSTGEINVFLYAKFADAFIEGQKKFGPHLVSKGPPPLGKNKGGLGPTLCEKACRSMGLGPT